MKFQTVTIKHLLEGQETLLRIAKEEKSGDHKIAYRLGRMQSKVEGIIGEGSPYDFARRSLYRQKTTLVKAKRPDGSDGDETRRWGSEVEKEAYEDQIMEMIAKEVQIPIGFINPADAKDKLKLDRPISAHEMALAWWLFDAEAIAALEKEIEGEG